MPGRRKRDRIFDRVDDSDERGDEAIGRFAAQREVGRFEHQHRIGMDVGDAADRLAHIRHRDRRQQSRPGNVADRKHDPSVVERERIVPVAADQRFGAARLIDRAERAGRDVRQRRGQGCVLEGQRDATHAFEELGVHDRRRDPARKPLEHVHVRGPERFLVAAHSDGKRAARRPTRHQRHDESVRDLVRGALVRIAMIM